MEATTFEAVPQAASSVGSLHRKIDWRGAFWVASGVPALVLFSIGAIAATVGKPAWIVWIVSILFGFIQALPMPKLPGCSRINPAAPRCMAQWPGYATAS